MNKKNLVIYYPSFEKGGVEENLKNLVKYFSNKFNIFIITSLSEYEAKKIFKKKKHDLNCQKK